MRREQFHTFDHPQRLVIKEPVLTGLKACYDRMPCRRRMLRCVLTGRTITASDVPTLPHIDGDETTNRSVTPCIRHTRSHLVSKRD